MRKQYHIRIVNGETLIWDVDRLVALAKSLPITRVPLETIREIDEPYWYRDGIRATCRSVATHMELIHDADLSFPVILSSDGRVFDGMHRIMRALLEGHAEIAAVRFDTAPPPDYRNVDPDTLPYA